ncbi:hypothetical protein PPACK8108_LOCUS15407, partial [Phakopsora pachyrhizi]
QITPFDHSMFCQRTLRELKLLKYFQEQNVLENLSCESHTLHFYEKVEYYLCILSICKN